MSSYHTENHQIGPFKICNEHRLWANSWFRSFI